MILDLPPIHPFAASFKANRVPPQREKKACVLVDVPALRPPLYSVSGPQKKKLRSSKDDFIQDGWMSDDLRSPSYPCEDRETAVWDTAIAKVVDIGHGAVSLR